MTKRNGELESQLKSFEQQANLARTVSGVSGDVIDGQVEIRLKEMEKIIRILKQEKDDLIKEKNDSMERLKIQDEELKDALTQKKEAMNEYSEVTDKLGELRSQKQKLSRQVRDKEEELETAMQKIDTLRNDIRKSDKFRRELESRLQDSIADATKVIEFI